MTFTRFDDANKSPWALRSASLLSDIALGTYKRPSIMDKLNTNIVVGVALIAWLPKSKNIKYRNTTVRAHRIMTKVLRYERPA